MLKEIEGLGTGLDGNATVTVQQLINELNMIEDKSRPVTVCDDEAMAMFPIIGIDHTDDLVTIEMVPDVYIVY